MKFHKHIANSTQKIFYKFQISIYKTANAINIEVQPKGLLKVFLGL